MTRLPRLLVTGSSGAIGRRLRARLDSAGADAVHLVGPRSEAPSDDRTESVDLTDPDRVRGVVERSRPDAIIHLAAVSGPACEADPALAEAVNVGATRSLAAAAREHGVRRFVLASTSAVYGDQYRAPVSETTELVLGSEYARTKHLAEEALAEEAARSELLTGTALRLFNVYGPGMSQALPNRLVAATPESPVTLFGLDGFVRDHVHVDDVIDALLAAAAVDAAPLTVNIGSGRPTSNRMLVRALEPVSVVVAAPRDSYSCAEVGLAEAWLDYRPSRPLTRDAIA